jgi:spermidine synthase
MIGGGVNGSIAQALKHPTVERIDSVELDPALIGMARQFFPAVRSSIRPSRTHGASALRGWPRYYLRTTGDQIRRHHAECPDPQTAQLNRFYTAEFFRSARDHLAPGGVLALELRSSEETISPDLAEFPALHRAHFAGGLSVHVAIPGETIHFFAATRTRCSDGQSRRF